MYEVADSTGYVLDFWIYRGAQYNSLAPTEVAVGFIQQWEDQKQLILWITDAGYGSLVLAQRLHDLGFKFLMACGCNRPGFLFRENLHSKLQKGNVLKSSYFIL